MRVVAQGRLKQRSYETREGEKRTVIELEVDEVGPSLRYATAKVNRTQRGSSTGGGFGGAPAPAAAAARRPTTRGVPPPPAGWRRRLLRRAALLTPRTDTRIGT